MAHTSTRTREDLFVLAGLRLHCFSFIVLSVLMQIVSLIEF